MPNFRLFVALFVLASLGCVRKFSTPSPGSAGSVAEGDISTETRTDTRNSNFIPPVFSESIVIGQQNIRSHERAYGYQSIVTGGGRMS